MPLTTDDHMEVFLSLDAEVGKALRAYEKARKAYEQRPYNYGGSVEDNKLCMLLQIRREQLDATRKISNDYFEHYISGAV